MPSLWLMFFIMGLLCSSFEAYAQSAANRGAVRGIVRLRTAPPELPALNVYKFKQICRQVPDESLVVGPHRGVRYAVLALEGVNRDKAVESEVAIELDNVGCRFVPHVQTATVGQFLIIKNSDPILHTAHAHFEERGQPQFNIGLYPGRVARKPLISPGVVRLTCDVHPWMRAYVVVSGHPYHAVTDALGEYLIPDVPPGAYRLKLWHESLGTAEKKVEVKGGAVTEMNFALAPKNGSKK